MQGVGCNLRIELVRRRGERGAVVAHLGRDVLLQLLRRRQARRVSGGGRRHSGGGRRRQAACQPRRQGAGMLPVRARPTSYSAGKEAEGEVGQLDEAPHAQPVRERREDLERLARDRDALVRRHAAACACAAGCGRGRRSAASGRRARRRQANDRAGRAGGITGRGSGGRDHSPA